MKTKISTFFLLAFLFFILYLQQDVSLAIKNAGVLFQTKIFPSLFPFLVLSPFFMNSGFFDLIRNSLGCITEKIFHISKNCSYLFFMSMISGFPGSAIYAKSLEEEHFLSKKEAYHTLLFCHFANPIFVLSMVKAKPYLVLFMHYSINFLIGFILRFQTFSQNDSLEHKKKKYSFFEIFTTSIKNAMQNALFILGVITFFFMLNAILDFPITHLLLEVSQGLNYLSTWMLSPKWIASLSAFLLSFGGFSVHIQVYGILSDWKISYWPFFFTRIVHGILSFIGVFLLF